jgi:uncharacterized protein GlcG (DUF336 family)
MGLQFKHKGRLTTIMGGIPIRDKDMKVIGGVGTSGTPSALDDNTVSQRCWSAMYDAEDPPLESRLDRYVKLVEAAMAKAEEMGLAVSVCLCDAEGWPKVFYRMDGALFPTAELARDKAWTAAAFRMPSSDISGYGVRSLPGLGIPTGGWNERVCPVPGGLPMFDADGELIGSVGVAGGTTAQDVRIAKTASKLPLP